MHLLFPSVATLLLGLAPAAEAAPQFPLYMVVQYCFGGTLDLENLDTQCEGPDWVIRLNGDGSGEGCFSLGPTPYVYPLTYTWGSGALTIDVTSLNGGDGTFYVGKPIGGGRGGGVITTVPEDPLNNVDGVFSAVKGNLINWYLEGCEI